MHPLTHTWQRFDALDVHSLYAVLALRCRVFVLEQGPYLDPDGLDQHSWHVLGHLTGSDANQRLVTYLRVVDPGYKYAEPSIGRVVCAPEWRGRGWGKALVDEGVKGCLTRWPGQGIRISAQAHLQPFYRLFGFETVGDVYSEDSIPHVQMFRRPS